MSTFVLVHAAFHTSWAWEGVKKELEKKGHKVIARDLPGHGLNKKPVKNVTMQDYVNSVKEIVSEESEPVILVGSSMGGGIISLVAEEIPKNIHKLVYVAAFMCPNGKTIMDVTSEDKDSQFLPNIMMSEDQSYCFFRKEEGLRENLMYTDPNKTKVEEALSRLMENQATQPFSTPMVLTDEKFGTIPRYYIECSNDLILTHKMQKRLQEDLPCQKTVTLNLPHIPYISNSIETSEALLSFL